MDNLHHPPRENPKTKPEPNAFPFPFEVRQKNHHNNICSLYINNFSLSLLKIHLCFDLIFFVRAFAPLPSILKIGRMST